MKRKFGWMEYAAKFNNDAACFEFLTDAKWSGGFECIKCGKTKCIKGRSRFYRRCQSCHYDESCTAGTLFHKLKFPVAKAFWIIYQISNIKKGISTAEIARQFNISQQTAWYFKRKVQAAMVHAKGHGSTESSSTSGVSEVDLEIIKLAKISVIENVDQMGFADGIKKPHDAPGYWRIYSVKNFMRGTHHRVSLAHLDAYLEEFDFRYERRKRFQNGVWDVLNSMVRHPHLPYRRAVAN